MLKWYYLDEFKSKDDYAKFIEYMLKNSDFFSVIYFRYNEQEPLKRSVKQIRDELRKYKIYSKNTKEWPGTVTRDEKHIYRIAYYRSDMKCLETLVRVGGLFNWDYPNAPMDLCFYRDNYCCLKNTAHEYSASMYIELDEKNFLELNGIELEEVLPRHVLFEVSPERLRSMGIPERSLEPIYCDMKKYLDKYLEKHS